MTFIERLDNYLKRNLTLKRYTHSVEVAKMTLIISEKLGLDSSKAYIAGLAHDIAREFPLDRLKKYLFNWGEFSKDFYNKPSLFHGPVGAYVLKKDFNIVDNDILEAVAYHSVGNKGMGTVSKIVYIADYISYDREHIDNHFREEILSLDLDSMIIKVIESVEEYLNSKGLNVVTETVETYEFLNKEKK